MTISVLTYNVLFNKASADVRRILSKHKPDVLCLQEIDTNEENLKQFEILNYKLADYSNSFIKFSKIYGVATFYNTKKLKLVKTDSLNLPKSVYELLLTVIRLLSGGNKPRTVLRTDFYFMNTRRRIVVYNAHLSYLGTNHSRTRQLEKTLNHIKTEMTIPLIVTGDFNYIYGRKKLEILFKKHKLKEATKNIYSTINRNQVKNWTLYKILKIFIRIDVDRLINRLKNDYIYYRNLQNISTEKIEVGLSDHFPIISFFTLK